MYDKLDLFNALAADPLFEVMPEASQKRLFSKMTFRSYLRKQHVYGFDDTPVGLYFLYDGALRLEWPGLFEVNVGHLYTPGSWFGQLSALTETKRLVTVTAATDAKIGFLGVSDMNILIGDDVEILRHLSRITQARLKTAIDIVADLMLRDSKKRLLANLARLSGITNPLYKLDSYEVYFSQEEIASMANLARTTTNTILNQLAKEKIIDISYRQIKVIKPKKLLSLIQQ